MRGREPAPPNEAGPEGSLRTVTPRSASWPAGAVRSSQPVKLLERCPSRMEPPPRQQSGHEAGIITEPAPAALALVDPVAADREKLESELRAASSLAVLTSPSAETLQVPRELHPLVLLL